MSLGQSPTDHALLDRIIGAPDDLAARLVYADLLTERGDPRGPFIALQCQHEARDVCDPEWSAEYATLARTLHAHSRSWNAAFEDRQLFPSWRHPDIFPPYVYRRGFIEEMGFDQNTVEYLPWARSQTPLRTLRLMNAASLEPILATGVKRFYLHGAWRSDDRSALARSVDGLTHFSAHESGMQVRGAQHLARALPASLRGLELHGGMIGNSGLKALLTSACAPTLNRLVISANSLSKQILARLFSDALPGLTELSIAHQPYFVGNLAPLSQWSRLPRLRFLSLQSAFDASDLAALAGTEVPDLEALNLATMRTKWTVADSAALARIPFRRLTRLNLANNRMGDEALITLLSSPHLHSLTHLGLSANSLTERGIAALLDAPLDRLVCLDLGNNRLTDEAVALLSASDKLSTLVHLDLRNNRRIYARGATALLDAKFNPVLLNLAGLPRALTTLDLCDRMWRRFGTAVRFPANGYSPPEGTVYPFPHLP